MNVSVELASKFVAESCGDYTMESLSLSGKTPMLVYISEDPECAYLGIQYVDGAFGVIGCRCDSIVTCDEMMGMLGCK